MISPCAPVRAARRASVGLVVALALLAGAATTAHAGVDGPPVAQPAHGAGAPPIEAGARPPGRPAAGSLPVDADVQRQLGLIVDDHDGVLGELDWILHQIAQPRVGADGVEDWAHFTLRAGHDRSEVRLLLTERARVLQARGVFQEAA